MLFNSYQFIFLFLPITLWIFFKIGNRGHHKIAISWLVGASLFFYAWWNPAYLALMLASILFNYAVGISVGGNNNKSQKKLVLILGIVSNLALLGYYKYANFFVDNLNVFFENQVNINDIILPLAISFFTFQQITYIVDAYKGETREYNFLHYCLFVTFFPQLIAGPIVHHKEMLPQFARELIYKFNNRSFIVGLTIFFIGLAKKVVLADSISVYATPVFSAAENETTLTIFEAWGGVLAYTFQIYFDFSGYSDMAIGTARMFGIRLPINFNSPYKAGNIIDFWKRWHMTLSRFLREYVYIPLGGNRLGSFRRYQNLIATMLLGGLWHGAGWTFIIWGALHGLYLGINHYWISMVKNYSLEKFQHGYFWRAVSPTLTLLSVIIAWVFFRAESLNGAMNILGSMAGLNGVSLPPESARWIEKYIHVIPDISFVSFNGMFSNNLVSQGWLNGIFSILVLYLIVTFAPNTQQIMYRYMGSRTIYSENVPSHSRFFLWKPSVAWLCVMLIISTYALISMIGASSEFLYFQF
jgi:alginate O-acetyltransferase complex protein AlgI